MGATLREINQSDDPRRDWRAFNDLVREAKRLQQQGEHQSLAIAEMQRKLTKTAGSGGSVQRFRVISESDDSLTCQKLDAAGAVIAGSFAVAKAQTLRRSWWLNRTVGSWTYTGSAPSRTATYAGAAVAGGLQPGDTIGEILDPPYAGSDIFASQVDGGTGVAGADWVDLNADARRYVAVRELVTLCRRINGVDTTMRLVVDGGPAKV